MEGYTFPILSDPGAKTIRAYGVVHEGGGEDGAAPAAREIPLYSGVAPGSENWSYAERAAGTLDKPQAQNIVRPVLLYYPAEKATAVETAMIVAPGGGFRTLMMSYEGVDV